MHTGVSGEHYDRVQLCIIQHPVRPTCHALTDARTYQTPPCNPALHCSAAAAAYGINRLLKPPFVACSACSHNKPSSNTWCRVAQPGSFHWIKDHTISRSCSTRAPAVTSCCRAFRGDPCKHCKGIPQRAHTGCHNGKPSQAATPKPYKGSLHV